MKRKQLPAEPEEKEGLYFAKSNVETFSSGCCLLDMVLGGGWPLGRFSNIVGDFSTGKSLLAIEACANFARQYPKGRIVYIETEAAFDVEYAQSLGLPTSRVEFPNEDEAREPITTVEQLFDELTKITEEAKAETLVIVDSLDAISDQSEMEREIDKGSFGQEKAKKLGQIFRRLVQALKKKRVHLLIVSQVRDAIGVMYGKKTRRSGGKALDFYASQVVWLSNVGKISKTKSKVERIIGVRIKAKAEKNKIGTPFRDCEFPIYFHFGIDDVEAGWDWMQAAGKVKEAQTALGLKGPEDYVSLSAEKYFKERQRLSSVIQTYWNEIEQTFAPKRSKYNIPE